MVGVTRPVTKNNKCCVRWKMWTSKQIHLMIVQLTTKTIMWNCAKRRGECSLPSVKPLIFWTMHPASHGHTVICSVGSELSWYIDRLCSVNCSVSSVTLPRELLYQVHLKWYINCGNCNGIYSMLLYQYNDTYIYWYHLYNLDISIKYINDDSIYIYQVYYNHIT